MTGRVAITGYSFRMPGTSTKQYWQDLLDSRDLVTQVDPGRWALDSFLHPRRNHPGTSYTFAAGSLGDIATFDAAFFGISPREAALMDPQQRLLLEMSWEAIENSGIKPSSLRGSRCGVYVGIASADYSYRLADDLAVIDSTTATGNTASIAANRISYVFDLRGPSMAIDTACSSSMVAFHQACRSILSGESTQALAGGISLHLHPYGFLLFAKATMLSPRGRCSVFDASGDGYVRSEGGGVFFLKDYDQALADGDPILAVVAGSAVNTDGRKSGLTVPSPRVQAALLEQTYAQAGIDPRAIDYLEAHGTGTAVGDPIETLAIGEALGKRRDADKPLPIGSVKSNLGHLETASGVAGLVKALHCIEHRLVPATIGVKIPNPNIKLGDWNIELVTKPLALKKTGKLIVGINSFGFGGSNAHVILESHPPAGVQAPETSATGLLPLIVSARDEAALQVAARELAAFLTEQPQNPLYDVAYSAAFRRERHPQQAIVFGRDATAIAEALLHFADDAPPTSTASDAAATVDSGSGLARPAGLAFIYTGNGSQWAGMGKRLLSEEPVFRAAVREVDALFRRHADYSLEDELASVNGEENRYHLTEIAQPALFAMQVGITRMLAQRGVTPTIVAGHSVGEVAAAWASGALSLADAVHVIYQRSRLQGTTKGQGQMCAVGLGQEDALALLDELGLAALLTLAGVNSARGVTIAGNPEPLALLETALDERKVFYKRLDLDYAFHSAAMDGIEVELKKVLADLAPRESAVPFCSTVSGQRLDGRQLDAEYWWQNIRKPVLLESAINAMLDEGANIFVEIGPNPILRSYLNDGLKERAIEGRVIATARPADDSPQHVWGAASQAIIAGAEPDWQQFFPRPGRFVQLPSYPWQRERHWHPVTAASAGLIYRRKLHPLLGYPLPQHALIWENQLDTQLYPVLADHVVGEATVFPGSAFAEMALAAAAAWQPEAPAAIENLEIRTPLLIGDEHSTSVRTTIHAHDGSLAIESREQLASDPWTLHATARLLHDTDDALLREKAPALPKRDPDFDGSSHAVLTRAVGIAYGPAFQCIDHGWVQGNSVLAVYRIAASVDSQLASHHLHPALLDCAFQLIFQLLKNAVETHDGLAFVPVRMGRIALCSAAARPSLARATLLRRSARSLQAEFAIFAADGSTIAVISDVRFRSVRLSRNAADRLRCLAYHATPRPHPLTPAARPSIAYASIRVALLDLVRRATLKGTHRRYTAEVDPLLDSLCSRFTRRALQDLSSDGQSLPAHAVRACQTATPEIEPYLAQLLSLAEDDRSLATADRGWEIVPDVRDQSSAQDIWNSLVADDPDYFQIVHSVGLVGMHLGELLAGQRSLSSVCPQDSSLATLLRQVLGTSGKQKIGRALRELIGGGLRDLPAGQRLGIVEISEGSPSFVMDACMALDFKRADYCFASPSATTLSDFAAKLKECSPAIETQLIAGSPEAAAGKSAGAASCALAILVLDFSSVEQAIQAIDYARSRLLAGGSLIVVGQHPARWIDFVFGARAAGWSQAGSGRWLSSQRPSYFWQQQLQEAGFSSSEPFEFSPDTLSGPYLLLGQLAASGALPSDTPRSTLRSWILFADPDGFSAQLSDQLTTKLQARGDLVIEAHAGDSAQIEALLRETTANYGELDGIVHLAGIVPEPDSAPADTVLERQLARCATAASIFQACASTQTKTTCWLITANAVSSLLPERAGAKAAEGVAATSAAADSALWGFGRTMLNEADHCAIRLIDLQTPLAVEIAAAGLDRELEQPDDEQEVALTSSGERYALRLRIEERPDGQAHEALLEPTLSLGFQLPGQLRNLRWEARPRRDLGPGEIEVDVHATGLNFRDVMYALGLLSDEAIENGFAGPTLGFEFSGIVSRTGSEDTIFSTGDEVVGFGPSSFGNRVVTQATAIAHLPPDISFEAAATIPSTFLTVYYALHHLAQLQPDEKVLIHGAAGGVGIAAVQVAKWLGAEIYATAGSDEKRDFLRLLGVDHIFDSRSLTFADQIMAETGGQGVDVVLNSLAGEAINRNFQVLKPFGRFLELGKRDFYENTKIGLRPFRNNISYFGIDADQLMLVRPDLTRRLFSEIMALFADGVLHPLPYHAFEAEDVVDAFRYMQQARQIGKIVITYRHGINHVHLPKATTRQHLELTAEGSYLVSGGLQGFGLRTAEWLASKGARQLILISRSGPESDAARDAIAQLEKQGVRVYATACDVTDRKALATLLAEAARTMPPLKGVVHAAAVIDDGLVRNLDAEQIRRVLAPKILGARHLDELTRDCALDLFLLFSSATTVFGNPGQASYVAANVFLEALAGHRRAIGLCATCVGWGPIDDVGFLARNEKIKEALQSRMGGDAINSATALDALEGMLLADRSGLAVLEVDWHALSRLLPSASSPKFQELSWHAEDRDGQEDQSEDIQRLLAELSDDELLATFTDILRNEIGEILRISADKIDPERSLYDMGLDSLMGVELMIALESRFGIRLPVMALSQSPTISKLAARVIQQLRGSEDAGEPDQQGLLLAQVQEVARQQGAEVAPEVITGVAKDLQSARAAATGRTID